MCTVLPIKKPQNDAPPEHLSTSGVINLPSHLTTNQCIHLPINPPSHPSIHPSTHLPPMYPFILSSIYPHLSDIHPSNICLSVCPSVYLYDQFNTHSPIHLRNHLPPIIHLTFIDSSSTYLSNIQNSLFTYPSLIHHSNI